MSNNTDLLTPGGLSVRCQESSSVNEIMGSDGCSDLRFRHEIEPPEVDPWGGRYSGSLSELPKLPPAYEHTLSQAAVPSTFEIGVSKEMVREEIKLLQIIDASDDESIMDYRFCYFPPDTYRLSRTIEAHLADVTRRENELIERPRPPSRRPLTRKEPRHNDYGYLIDSHANDSLIERELANQFKKVSLAGVPAGPNIYNGTAGQGTANIQEQQHPSNQSNSVIGNHITQKELLNLVPVINFGEFATDIELPSISNGSQSQIQLSIDSNSVENRSNARSSQELLTQSDSKSYSDRKSTRSDTKSRATFASSDAAASESRNTASSIKNQTVGAGRCRAGTGESQSVSSLEIKSLERSTMDSRDMGDFLMPNSANLLASTRQGDTKDGFSNIEPQPTRSSVFANRERIRKHRISRASRSPKRASVMKNTIPYSHADREFRNKLNDMLEQTGVLNISNGCTLSIPNGQDLLNDKPYANRRMYNTWRGVRSKLVSSRCSSLLSTTDPRACGSTTSKGRFPDLKRPKKPWFKRVHETNQRLLKSAARVMFSKIDEFQGMSFERLSEAAKKFDRRRQDRSAEPHTATETCQTPTADAPNSAAPPLNKCHTSSTLPPESTVPLPPPEDSRPSPPAASPTRPRHSTFSFQPPVLKPQNLFVTPCAVPESVTRPPEPKSHSVSSMPSAWKVRLNPDAKPRPGGPRSPNIALAKQIIPLKAVGYKTDQLPNNSHGMYGYL
ncbi:AaceriAFL122Wp [[Ashbya] aceris (nom. inval.)]|nr:AaceriAFL122Wp [[Ashbya] aceris (nom. inval.)]